MRFEEAFRDRLDDMLMAVRHGKRVLARCDAEGQLLQSAAGLQRAVCVIRGWRA